MNALTLEPLPEPLEPHRSPFGSDHEGFNPRWWGGRLFRDVLDLEPFAVRDHGRTVARVEMKHHGEIGHYDPPMDGRTLVAVDFIEVATPMRGAGIGRAVVNLLIHRFAPARLYALSEADGFWEALGWARVEHPSERDSWRPLYIAP